MCKLTAAMAEVRQIRETHIPRIKYLVRVLAGEELLPMTTTAEQFRQAREALDSYDADLQALQLRQQDAATTQDKE